MSMFERARWGELHRFFTDGNPPLILLLLALNTIFLMIYVYRKVKAKHKMHPNTVYAVQIILIGCNFAVAFNKAWLPYFSNVRMPI
jgi:hypothetical protein